MIRSFENFFWIDTAHSSYIFEKTKFGHLAHIYYGPLLSVTINLEKTLDALRHKRSAPIGSSVVYDQSDELYSLDSLCLEWSGIGQGDFRFSPLEIQMPDSSFVHDFVYKSHRVCDGNIKPQTLPAAYGSESDCMSLEILLEDASNQMTVMLIYTVYEQTDVITRRAVITNHNLQGSKAVIRRALSMMIDLPNRNFQMTTFDGGWIKETHRNDRMVTPGMHVNASTTGNSSNRHNPGFLLAEQGASEEHGWVYGFNLVYSGNHFGSVELSNHDLVRVSLGINSHCFEWMLNQGESFETPEVVMAFSDKGFNGVSHHLHDFINQHIVRGDWKNKVRPILCNNWEAHFFDFDEQKLLALARQAKKLGVELFVLDDGWFGKRDDDQAGLGDYSVNKKKLPRGLKSFSEKLKAMGLSFGLWFEPEMVNMNSDLYRAHPEYAVTVPGKKPTLGRHQLLLDLCMPQVQDYIVDSVSKVLDESDVSYVKWDMNRHMTDLYSTSLVNQGAFYHQYMMGLYSVLDRIFSPRPHILLESCSSGGNRFDLGMLCYSPQIWASDNTDPIERLKIQGGLSYLYPPSTMGAHVSSAPHQQTLRETPLSTRFNVAAFGCLGYEMDLKYLSKVEREEVKAQINYYKIHRQTLQFGRFSRITSMKANKVFWQVAERDGSKVISGLFQTMTSASEGFDRLKILGLDPEAQYSVETKPQNLYVEQFGELVKHILPVPLNPNGAILRFANRVYCLSDGIEQYEGQGHAFESGILLNNQYMGTGYNKQLRVLGDFGSSLYLTEKLEKKI